jgi:hypothetical protein
VKYDKKEFVSAYLPGHEDAQGNDRKASSILNLCTD